MISCSHSNLQAIRIAGNRSIVICRACQRSWVPAGETDAATILNAALTRVSEVFSEQKLTMPPSIRVAIVGEHK